MSPADAARHERRHDPTLPVCWDNPLYPERWLRTSWAERLLCRLGLHEEVYDGNGWDGGAHCARCGTNWVVL